MLAKRRLLPFVQRLNPRYDAGWVHKDICRRLEKFSDDVAKGLSPRLMILMPPRHGKSELASRMFPAWHLGRHMDHEVIACAYNVSLAMSFSRKVKEAMDDPSYQSVFEARLNPEFRSNEEWGLANGRGGYVAAGVGGGITGKGAHVLVIDDPIKNAEEADSADVREKLWDWYGSTAYTRLAPGGGVLVIQCMTGDTPVRLPDGTEKRLDALRAGDEVATYDDGRLGVSTVAAWKSNGRDLVYKITMNSGKMVRANGRHPFLVSTDGGLKWVRTKHLTTDHTIVACLDSGGSGLARPALQTGANSPPNAAASALPTTGRKNGLMGTARRPSTQCPSESGTSSTGTASRLKRMLNSWLRRAADALSAATSKTTGRPGTGAGNSVSTTTTTPVKSVGCCATTATPPQGTPVPSASPSHWPSTSDFMLDGVRSVELAGEEEVFDVQIDRTENFIANGLVSHNTWWHDDDLAGRLQTAMATDDEADQFELVKYPAVAEADEYLSLSTDLIEYDVPSLVPGADGVYASTESGEKFRPLRAKGEPLHPERYDLVKLNRIKKTIPARFWAALYQQNPVPDDGAYFTKENFRRGQPPQLRNSNIFVAFDFAISEKKQNDYTVGVVGLQDYDDVLHVVDMVRFKSGDGMFIVESILNLCQKWYSPHLQLGFEDGQIFRAIETLLKKRMRERRFYPSSVLLKPITDKMARARPLQGRMQQGMVSFSDSAEWYEGARAEMLRFPAGVHDDQVDALAWMATMAVNKEPPRRPKTKEPESWRKKLSVAGGVVSHMSA
ncbi:MULTISPECIES: terminase large subunit domain-containing protein [unclassified Acidovorax]|uniref:terminase large subunit domain-containing protein n=1 Tax=unclassified Acidovorax TaxID=2684926 RepID=UPI0013031BAE|nr:MULTISPECIES: terminase family protein [unclassified Acidovorax]